MKVWILQMETGGYESDTFIERVYAYPPRVPDIVKQLANEGVECTEERAWAILTDQDRGWEGGYYVNEWGVTE